MKKNYYNILTSNVLCQGMTGKNGTFHSKNMLAYGTNIIAGVTPGKGGSYHLGTPIFNSVNEAKTKTKVDTSVIFVPALNAYNAIKEAILNKIQLIICITEGIAVHDMLKIKSLLKTHPETTLIGPNCPGFIIPDIISVGIMPSNIFTSGNIAIFSRSGTLAYEAVMQTSNQGLGQSIVMGIGGDLIKGINFINCLEIAKSFSNTKAILFIGEIGGNEEQKLAEALNEINYKNLNPETNKQSTNGGHGSNTFPIFAYIAGECAPKQQRMGHAGAIIGDEKLESAVNKQNELANAGVIIIKDPTKIANTIAQNLTEKT